MCQSSILKLLQLDRIFSYLIGTFLHHIFLLVYHLYLFFNFRTVIHALNRKLNMTVVFLNASLFNIGSDLECAGCMTNRIHVGPLLPRELWRGVLRACLGVASALGFLRFCLESADFAGHSADFLLSGSFLRPQLLTQEGAQ